MNDGAVFDLVIRGATVFDGHGGPPRTVDVGVAADRIEAVAVGLDARDAPEIDGTGRWLVPGMWDIHTHLDLEVELDRDLTEVIRHGTTSAVIGNCSLGLAFGRQNDDGHDPVVSCFARVENLPKSVLRSVADKITWTNPRAYLEHLREIEPGADLHALLPHSMLRIEVMGFDAAVTRDATDDEIDRMAAILEDALDLGYVGFSTDALPFHYLADDPYRREKIPTQHASNNELGRLTDVVRRLGKVWQATPPKDKPLLVARNLLRSSRRGKGRTLKVTAVAALDLTNNKLFSAGLTKLVSRIVNSKIVGGELRLQALGAPFRIYASGPITPIAEEIPAFRELNEIDLEDSDARRELIAEPAFRARFRETWYADKRGISIDRLRRLIPAIEDSLSRDLDEMILCDEPVADWDGETMTTLHARVDAWQKTGRGDRSDSEAAAFARLPNPIGDEVDFLLGLLAAFDTDLRWYTVIANSDDRRRLDLLLEEDYLPGFSDAGAHLHNMAFYDANLRALQLTDQLEPDRVPDMVRRLSREPARFWGIDDVGTIEPGQRADLVLIDPDALRTYDSIATMLDEHRPELGARHMRNRSDGVVTGVWKSGAQVWPQPADRSM